MLPDEIYSMTPILFSTTYKDARSGELFSIPERNAKALEIQTWLHRYALEPYQYVIVDDENVFSSINKIIWFRPMKMMA